MKIQLLSRIFLLALGFIVATCSRPQSDEAPATRKPDGGGDVNVGNPPKDSTVGDLKIMVIAPEKNDSIPDTDTLTYADVKPLLDGHCIGCHSNAYIDFTNYPFKYDKDTYHDDKNFNTIAKYRTAVDPNDPNVGEDAMPPVSEPVMAAADRAKLATFFAQQANPSAPAATPNLPQVSKVQVKIGESVLADSEVTFALSGDKKQLMTHFKLTGFDAKTSTEGSLNLLNASGTSLETRTFKIDPKGKLEDLTTMAM